MSDSPSRFATDDQFIEAAVRYLDGTLAETDVVLLSRDLESDAARRALFADIALQAQMLKDYGSPTTDESVALAGITPHPAPARRRFLAAAVTATLLGIVLIGVWWAIGRNRPPSPVAVIAGVDGRVSVLRASGETEPATAGVALYIGDGLLLDGPDAAAHVQAGERLRLSAAGQARLTCDDAGRFRLDWGELSIDLAGDGPFRVETPHAEFSAAAGDFELLVTEPWTDLTVESGRAELTSRSTSERTVVPERARALVIPGRAVAVMTPPPPLPTEWGEDFEHGLPDGWHGRLVTEELPVGSRGAITVEIERANDGLHYSIVAPDAWDTGLARVTPTTHLNFTYRLGRRPNWCNLLLTTRPTGPVQPDYFLNRFRDDELWNVAGQWRTVHIPLTAFEKKLNDQFTTEAPAAGEMVAGFSFSSIDTELDLTIDRIWLSANGPGRVTYEAVDQPAQEVAP